MSGRKTPSRFAMVPTRALEDERLDAYDVMLLIAMEQLGYRGTCKKGLAEIADMARCGTSTARRKIAQLASLGYVKVTYSKPGKPETAAIRQVLYDATEEEPEESSAGGRSPGAGGPNETDSSSDSCSSSSKKNVAGDSQSKKRAPIKETWLTAPMRHWREVVGGEAIPGKLAVFLRPVVNAILRDMGYFGEDRPGVPSQQHVQVAEAEMAARFRRYLEDVALRDGKPKMAGASRFMELHGQYASNGKAPTKRTTPHPEMLESLKHLKLFYGCRVCHRTHWVMYGEEKRCRKDEAGYQD